MRAVLYTKDFEPITVIELSRWTADFLLKRHYVVLPVRERLTQFKIHEPIDLAGSMVKLVRIRAERFVKDKDHEALVLFTDDDEHALLLEAAFLPGQRQGLKDRAAEAFGEGFLAALGMVGKP